MLSSSLSQESLTDQRGHLAALPLMAYTGWVGLEAGQQGEELNKPG